MFVFLRVFKGLLLLHSADGEVEAEAGDSTHPRSVYSYAGISLSIPAGHMDTVLECSDLGHPSLSLAAFFEWSMVIGFAGVSYTGAQEALLIDQ
mgnify:CR=1 FL=1